ncbi:hypothetical protein [Psychromonas ossibalaenae]|uniref:hypothetical protein n=1 Tax=Psychromonas ossibalaenae TaxID=444922 RepID=UPI000363256D|nr:hypothetical protein [Psychromonas ossibalaenae]
MNNLRLVGLAGVLFLASISNTQASVFDADVFQIGDWSRADPILFLGIKSYHIQKSSHEHLNENNPSIGIELWDISVVYVSKNSWNDTSVFVTYVPDYEVNNYLSLRAFVGFATGYYDTTSLRVQSGENEYTTLTPSVSSSSGVIPIAGVGLTVYPLGSNFGINADLTPDVLMFSASYKF